MGFWSKLFGTNNPVLKNDKPPLYGGDAKTPESAVVVNCASMSMANALIDRFIGGEIGSNDWKRNVEYFVKVDGVADYTIRCISTEFAGGGQRSVYFNVERPMNATKALGRMLGADIPEPETKAQDPAAANANEASTADECQKIKATINAYLAGILPILEPAMGQSACFRPACQLFIIGMVDRIRQVYRLDSATFSKIVESVLTDHGLMPSGCSAADFISRAADAAQKSEVVRKMIEEGATSIRAFVRDGDSDAPSDLGRVMVYAQKNVAEILALFGA